MQTSLAACRSSSSKSNMADATRHGAQVARCAPIVANDLSKMPLDRHSARAFAVVPVPYPDHHFSVIIMCSTRMAINLCTIIRITACCTLSIGLAHVLLPRALG